MSSDGLAGGVSPEQQAISDQHTLDLIARDEAIHAISHLLDELTETQLATLNNLFTTIALSSTEAVRMAAYYSGLTSGEQHRRFNRCPACGVVHEAVST